MHLSANKLAQFFIQHEFSEVEVLSDRLVLCSARIEQRIPFTVWCGKVGVSRSLLWGELTFYSHVEQDKQTAWSVQGLPWDECQRFAREAINQYQQWHAEQCAQLRAQLPKWQRALDLLVKKPAYLTHCEVQQWRDSVSDDLKTMGSTLEEAEQRMPQALELIANWVRDSDTCLDQRNAQWLEQERLNWEVLFAQIESSPLNLSQQQAVLINNDHNLVLAGAGTGKTSVLTARVAYLLQSHIAQAEQLLMLAFGSDAAREMKQRLDDKVGMAAESVTVNTFHQLGLRILNQVEQQDVVISPLATDKKLKQVWCTQWLKQHWVNGTNFRRWQKHLSQWPIAYLKGDEELAGQTENPKLIAWLETQLDQLCLLHLNKKQLQERIVEQDDYPRLNSELALVWPCYQAWQTMLKEENQIDFYSMITRATHYVEKGKFISPWKFIMVDEYQDISPDRLALIEALCGQTKQQPQEEKASLFAVGDDWQSIYQFAGSDINLTAGFSRRYASSTIHTLDTTYRFNSQIGAVADKFIQQNPDQLPKQITSHCQQKQKAVYVMPARRIEKELKALDAKTERPATVLLLGRNHYHRPEALESWQKQFPGLTLNFMTCHASKGREADYVFILNVDEGQFPSVKRQLHLDSVLSRSQEDYPHAEERRLFYVAMTRAREKVWVTYETHESEFVKELLADDYAIVKKR